MIFSLRFENGQTKVVRLDLCLVWIWHFNKRSFLEFGQYFSRTCRSEGMALPALKDTEANTLQQTESDMSALFDMSELRSEFGAPDSLRFNVLNWVLDGRYDKAIEELRAFMEQPSEYPNFKDKTLRYNQHAIDLIYAIKAKGSFPGLTSLTRAKQQELREKFKSHFKELQAVLRIIENIQGDLRVQDARSTIIVVRAMWFSILAIVALALWMDVSGGLAKTSFLVFDDFFGQFANWVADKIGF